MNDWKSELSKIYDEKAVSENKQKQFMEEAPKRIGYCISNIIEPAFNELKTELEKHGRKVTLYSSNHKLGISVDFEDRQEYDFYVYIGENTPNIVYIADSTCVAVAA